MKLNLQKFMFGKGLRPVRLKLIEINKVKNDVYRVKLLVEILGFSKKSWKERNCIRFTSWGAVDMKRLKSLKLLKYIFGLVAGILLIFGGCDCEYMIDAFLKGVYYVILEFEQCKSGHKKLDKTAFHSKSCLYFCHRMQNHVGTYRVDVALHLEELNDQGNYTANYTYVEELTTNSDEFSHEESGILINGISEGAYKVWAVAKFTKTDGSDHFELTTPSFSYYHSPSGGGGNQSAYSVRAVMGDSCIVHRAGEETNIPYTLLCYSKLYLMIACKMGLRSIFRLIGVQRQVVIFTLQRLFRVYG